MKQDSGHTLLNNYLTEGSEAREQDEKEREELLHTNNLLHEQIAEIKNKFKDCPTSDEHKAVLQKHRELEEQIQAHVDEKRDLK